MPLVHDFDQYITWLASEDFQLPFEFGGATQCGRLNTHNNNQDSIAIIGEGSTVVGVVCDGCTTAAGGYSQNEVGSRLVSVLAANLVGEFVKENGVAKLAGQLSSLEKSLSQRLVDFSRFFVTARRLDQFLESFFMTTVIVFAVDTDNYSVFGCGDGFFGVNGNFTNLETQDGNYITSRLMNGRAWLEEIDSGNPAIKAIAGGKTKKLNSLLIASDGFADLQNKFPDLIYSFAASTDVPTISHGYNGMMTAEFRRRVLFQPTVESWAESQDSHDDRSFLLLRRHMTSDKRGKTTCSKSRRGKLRKPEDFSERSQASAPITLTDS